MNNGLPQIPAGTSPIPSLASQDPGQSMPVQPRVGGGVPNIVPGQRRRGSCKFFNSQKGFGFIIDSRPEELDNQEVFVHWTSIMGRQGFKSLAEGEEVEYEIQQTAKGYSAINMTGPGGRPVIGDPRARSTPPNYMYNNPYAMRDLGGAGALGGMDPFAAAGLFSPYQQHTVMLSPTVVSPLSPHLAGAAGQLSPALAGTAGLGSPGLGSFGMAQAAALRGISPASLAQAGQGMQVLSSPLLQQQQQGLGGFGMGMNSGLGVSGGGFNQGMGQLGYGSPGLGGNMGGGGRPGSTGAGSARNSPSIGGFPSSGGLAGGNPAGLGLPELEARFTNGFGAQGGQGEGAPDGGAYGQGQRDLLYSSGLGQHQQ